MSKASELITYDPSGIWLEGSGISAGELADLAPRLERARRAVLDADASQRPAGAAPAETCQFDAGFLELPERTLDDYVDRRERSRLGRILKNGRDLQEAVDRVVVLGSGGWRLGGRALMEACCEPHFNELSRGQRGGRPRLYFVDNPLDNDAAQGLLKLLTEGRSPHRLEDRWALVVISRDGRSLETEVAFRQFLGALRLFYGDRGLAERVVPVTGTGGRLSAIFDALGCGDHHTIADAVGEPFSVFSAAGLLPAAILGLDVVRLLEGASCMNDHFRTAPPGANAVLDYAGVAHLMEQRQATVRVLQVWASSLEAIGRWYDRLLAESLTHAPAATTLTAVNPRDLSRRSRPGQLDKLLTNVVVDHWRCDSWCVGHSSRDQDALQGLADKTLPELMADAAGDTAEAYRRQGQPAAQIRLPRIDAWTIGQLLQMLMLATAVEGRLIGIDPHRQPVAEQDSSRQARVPQRTGPCQLERTRRI